LADAVNQEQNTIAMADSGGTGLKATHEVAFT